MVNFDKLGSILEQQFSIGENKLSTLDKANGTGTQPYGVLGKFANQFDQSAERSYTEEGMYRTDLYNAKIKKLEIFMQEPDVTILVKKRAFASLAENYRSDLLSKDEKLFLRATKFLFQNKCKQISAFEKLSKLESVITDIGSVDHYLLPVIFNTTDILSSSLGALGIGGFGKFKAIIDRVKTIVNLSHDNIYTTWTTNVNDAFRSDLGEGTGVIEFTTAANVSTTTSINFGQGSFRIDFADPHQLMRITHNDIEQAIADATNVVSGNSFLQLGLSALSDTIKSDKDSLNKIRKARGVNPINFLVDPETFLGKRVRAIIDNSGIEIKFDGSIFKVDIDPAYLDSSGIVANHSLIKIDAGSLFQVNINGAANNQSVFDVGQIAQQDSLNGHEVDIFKRIIRGLFNSLQINQNSQTVAKTHNASTNHLRKKLRLHYGSKSIIQPMDSVHIFVSSKTKIDTKITGGLQDSFNAFNFLQTTNKAMSNLQDLFTATGSSVEKAIFVGNDFPNWLWLMMRNQFIKDKSGTQISCGLVESVNAEYNSGVYTVSVNGKDNTEYFNLGVVNYKPALEVWNGSLYDPITPFDIKFDSASGVEKDKVPQLLQENQELFNSVFVKYKNGIYVGKKPTVNNFVQDTERVQNNSIRRVFYDPDGMVYKWKEGIGTLVMFGNNYQDSPTTNTGTPPQTKDPFAGQDVMNVLSLLITGEPYNFATFYKAASQFDNYGRDLITGADPSVSFFRNLQTDLKKRNLLYGDFVPFKKLTMDSNTYKNIVNNQIRANGFDNELNDLLAKKADLSDRVATLNNYSLSDATIDTSNLQNQLDDINIQIITKRQQITTELSKIDKPISVIGDDVSLDYDVSADADLIVDRNKLSNTDKTNKELRKKSHFLTRRLSWKVRANEDVNLFIVDDSYDKDYDIQAFEKSFVNPEIFKGDYNTVASTITDTAQLLDLEIFANTQGHIEVRQPKYNKMPSSVFYRMLRLKDEFDIQLYPQFIEDLYVNQIDNILDRLEVIEDEIRMYGLALALSTDANIESYLKQQTPNLNTRQSLSAFKFVSNELYGTINRLALKNMSEGGDPVVAENLFASPLTPFDSIQTQSTISDILTTSTRVDLLKTLSSDTKTTKTKDLLSSQTTITREQQINSRLIAKTQTTFDLKQLFPGSSKLDGHISQVDLFKILGEITQRVSERQKILKVAASAIKNAKEGLSLIRNDKKIGNKLLVAGSSNNSQLPAAFEGLIEDENYDDYGPGSGSRYIIKDYHIKSLSVTEKKPQFTSVEIHGSYGDNFIDSTELPADLNGFSGGGNALSAATAVDYDMWRMYGNSKPQSITVPFLTDPTTQCAPFAVAVLNKARKQINDGSNVVIFGNEYMQPGEVIYLESQDTLYYVQSVIQSISYGKSFSTTLNLCYGHMPGEYIPTYLDTAGKILYKNKDISNFVSRRDSSVNNDEHIGTIVGSLNNSNVVSQGLAINSIMQGTFANENRQTLNKILETAENVFSTTSADYNPILELRIFAASNSYLSTYSDTAIQIAQAIQDFLSGDNNMYESAQTKHPEIWLKDKVASGQIKIVFVNSDDTKEFRSPSSSAFFMARRAYKKSSSFGTNLNLNYQIDKIINNYVVDIWIYAAKQ